MVTKIRNERLAWSEKEETQKIKAMIEFGSNLEAVESCRLEKGRQRQGRNELEFTVPVLKGRVCREAFEAIYGFTHPRIQRLINSSKDILSTRTAVPAGMASSIVPAESPKHRRFEALAFLKECVEMRSSVNPIDAQYHECVWTREDFYKAYEAQMEKRKKKPLKRTAFYALWQNGMKGMVRILGQSPCNKTCGMCATLNRCIQASVRWAAINERFKVYMKIHKKSEMEEVALYYQRMEHALQHPEKALSVAGDGAAQWRHNVPQLLSSDQYSGVQLSQHLILVIVHGIKTFVFRNLEHLPNNANLVIHCLNHTFNWILDQGKPLPPILYWQSDCILWPSGSAEGLQKGLSISVPCW